MIYLIYPILGILLFYNCKLYKNKEWNEEYMSLKQAKAVQGFCAVAIMLHHIAQKTCAPWVPRDYVVHGLDPFVSIGIFFVGVFLFCSGYGLIKSLDSKEDYLKNFYAKRIRIIVVSFITIGIIYYVARYLIADQMTTLIPWLFVLRGPNLSNSYCWYIVTMFYFYIAFYIIFKLCRNRKIAIFFMYIITIIYMLGCEWWMYGEWWFNTILLFPLGMSFAQNENKIIPIFKKIYYIITPIILIGSIGLVYVYSYIKGKPERFLDYPYIIYRWSIVLLQLLSTIFFVVFVIMCNLKIKFGNKFLNYLGKITLEFYLIHGMYVQLFGYSFFIDGTKPVCYIKNLILFLFIVFLLSLFSAIILHRTHIIIVEFIEKHLEIVRFVIFGKWKRNIIVVLALFLLLTCNVYVSSNIKRKENQDIYNNYIENNIKFTDVNGKRLAYYDVGEGKYTIVIFRKPTDFCPTITYKPIADGLSDNYRVIVFDFLGSGFSDDTKEPRTSENISEEIHIALKNIGIESNIILVANLDSECHAKAYAYKYPEEVKAFVGIDTLTPNTRQALLNLNGQEERDYNREVSKTALINYNLFKGISKTGYTKLFWPVVKLSYDTGHTEDEITVLEEVFCRHYWSKATISELSLECSNNEYVMDKAFYDDLHVALMLTYVSRSGYAFDSRYNWMEEHEKELTNKEIQKCIEIGGNPDIAYTNPSLVIKEINKYLKELDK